ncbi:gram positive anchor, partial [Streptococcus oralis SK100]|uniref:LPXTG cell wall anchor domain-containing protein n=1 Tax=Streptococcus oralis TaxID=1303 RepID=UPI000258411B
VHQHTFCKGYTHTGKPQPQPSLPNTGTAASMLPVVGMILGLLGLAGFRKHKK